MPTFVLLHSPLGSPMTWDLVAAELQRRGEETAVPRILSTDRTFRPFWRQHLRAVQFHLQGTPRDEQLVLVGHSGGGVLLPLIRDVTRRPVAAYLFVDAAIPENGKSRLDLFSTKKEAGAFRKMAQDGRFPVWDEASLETAIPDSELRGRFVSQMQPLPVDVYEEPIPVFKGWPDAPCGYLQFSATYDDQAADAKKRGWPVERIDGEHFHMLVDPTAVANSLIQLSASPAPKK